MSGQHYKPKQYKEIIKSEMGVYKKRIVLKHLSVNRENRSVLKSPNSPRRKLEFAVRKLLREKFVILKDTI